MNQSKFQIRRRGRGIQVVNTETDEVIHSSGDQSAADRALRDARKAERAERQAAKTEQGDKTAGNGAGIAKTFESMANGSTAGGPARKPVFIGYGAGGGLQQSNIAAGGAGLAVGGTLVIDANAMAESAIARLATEHGFVKMTEELASDIRQAAFIVETVAHARGLTREFLPIVDRLREAIGSK